MIPKDIVKKIISEDLQLAGEAVDNLAWDETALGIEACVGNILLRVYDRANKEAARRESGIIELGYGLKPGQSTGSSGYNGTLRWYTIISNRINN